MLGSFIYWHVVQIHGVCQSITVSTNRASALSCGARGTAGDLASMFAMWPAYLSRNSWVTLPKPSLLEMALSGLLAIVAIGRVCPLSFSSNSGSGGFVQSSAPPQTRRKSPPGSVCNTSSIETASTLLASNISTAEQRLADTVSAVRVLSSQHP